MYSKKFLLIMQKLLSNKNFIIYSGHSQTNQQLIWEILLNEWFYFLYLNILMITLKEGFEYKPFLNIFFLCCIWVQEWVRMRMSNTSGVV